MFLPFRFAAEKYCPARLLCASPSGDRTPFVPDLGRAFAGIVSRLGPLNQAFLSLAGALRAMIQYILSLKL